MAKLAIKGHETRGREVIEFLEMLGGKKTISLYGNETSALYSIFNDGHIDCFNESHYNKNEPEIFTLEELLEKFPYKVGDKVKLDYWPCTITKMYWNGDNIIYYVKGADFSKGVYATDLQPYKEEIMEDKSGQIKIDIPDGYEFFGIDDDSKIVLTKKQPQYPKTIEECAKLLSTLPHTRNGVSGYSSHALWKFQQLLICRDAYWKIAGEQMGLGKPWEPDWKDDSDKYFICYIKDELFMSNIKDCNRFLVFPTEEMRDAFFDNFKELIEECKQFL